MKQQQLSTNCISGPTNFVVSVVMFETTTDKLYSRCHNKCVDLKYNYLSIAVTCITWKLLNVGLCVFVIWANRWIYKTRGWDRGYYYYDYFHINIIYNNYLELIKGLNTIHTSLKQIPALRQNSRKQSIIVMKSDESAHAIEHVVLHLSGLFVKATHYANYSKKALSAGQFNPNTNFGYYSSKSLRSAYPILPQYTQMRAENNHGNLYDHYQNVSVTRNTLGLSLWTIWFNLFRRLFGRLEPFSSLWKNNIKT